ncbi:MAG: GTP cyclohydrolase II [Boseongicola sp.]|nr:MAG: GTP cyclohydrolase II [Boseongicola sp.]
MSLLPTLTEKIARARTDLRLGLPVVLQSNHQTALIFAAEGLTPERLTAARALGPLELAITARRAETLRARTYDGDIARLSVPSDATTKWVAAATDPKDDLSTPLKGPYQALRDGDATLHRLAVRLVKSAWLLPAALVVPVKNLTNPELTHLEATATSATLESDVSHQNIVTGRVPLQVSEAGRVHVFRPSNGGEEHVACEIGRPARDRPVLVRLHSACFTGDVLGSLKCDCGPQLHSALKQMGGEGAGVLLYLNQEGRGIGLANKMRAYALQDQGFDTVEANHRLGFEDDERDFRTGADLLKRLGFSSARLLTNNPAKVDMLRAQGIDVVERVPLKVGLNPLNEKYLDVKAKKSGHIL